MIIALLLAALAGAAAIDLAKWQGADFATLATPVKITSPPFAAKDTYGGMQWYIEVFPMGNEIGKNTHLGLYLGLHDAAHFYSKSKTIDVSFDLSVVGKEKVKTLSFKKKLSPLDPPERADGDRDRFIPGKQQAVPDDVANPLLVSVRSGARASMPGMMDTVLNLGLNDESVEGLAAASGDARFAYDSYRRFIQMYGDVVLGGQRPGAVIGIRPRQFDIDIDVGQFVLDRLERTDRTPESDPILRVRTGPLEQGIHRTERLRHLQDDGALHDRGSVGAEEVSRGAARLPRDLPSRRSRAEWSRLALTRSRCRSRIQSSLWRRSPPVVHKFDPRSNGARHARV